MLDDEPVSMSHDNALQSLRNKPAVQGASNVPSERVQPLSLNARARDFPISPDRNAI
jgi:hypothetical protein